ncbi:MAG TPA: glutamate-1-semialdehyde 2,1-aminomutase [Planctomycetota bacterium]|nr:glutamate-1-semialdehyde 2,1-aminomutase [Planctomycetota bacterium]
MSEKRLKKSGAAFERAKKAIPGGVNSPVRAFGAVGGTPPFIAKGSGAHLTDIDGNEYIDYVGSWGPLILGHAHPKVVAAIKEAAEDGSSFGAPTERETRLAEEIKDAFPSMELVRMVSSGTEAVMSAVRLARGFTGRDRVIKFDGCYHGHTDALLVKAGSGATTFGHPSSPGVPEGLARDTVSLRYNDADAVADYLAKNGDEVAALIVEPVAGNMGVVPPAEGFLEALRELTQEHGVLLIFDEVITGFRIARGGAEERFGVTPDLTVLGKIIGGGLPVGAYGGRRDIMERIAPLGPVYQAGTLSGNPLAMAAGLATLEALKKPGTYEDLERKGKLLSDGLLAAAKEAGVRVTSNRVGSMMTLFFGPGKVTNYDDALTSDRERFARWHAGMLARGVYLAPSQFEATFVSTAHSGDDIRETIAAAVEVFETLRESS